MPGEVADGNQNRGWQPIAIAQNVSVSAPGTISDHTGARKDSQPYTPTGCSPMARDPKGAVGRHWVRYRAGPEDWFRLGLNTALCVPPSEGTSPASHLLPPTRLQAPPLAAVGWKVAT